MPGDFRISTPLGSVIDFNLEAILAGVLADPLIQFGCCNVAIDLRLADTEAIMCAPRSPRMRGIVPLCAYASQRSVMDQDDASSDNFHRLVGSDS